MKLLSWILHFNSSGSGPLVAGGGGGVRHAGRHRRASALHLVLVFPAFARSWRAIKKIRRGIAI